MMDCNGDGQLSKDELDLMMTSGPGVCPKTDGGDTATDGGDTATDGGDTATDGDHGDGKDVMDQIIGQVQHYLHELGELTKNQFNMIVGTTAARNNVVMSQEMWHHMDQNFDQTDRDGNGVIDRQEWQDIMGDGGDRGDGEN